jgi:4-hydroxy-tetrahydrodipicolinate synthase
MRKSIPNGVWPTMLTPLTNSNEIDYRVLEDLVEWYLEKQVDGLFAVCQSSEMFFLSLDERIGIARRVVKAVSGQIPVIASGHISDNMAGQVREVQAIADTGVDAVVLVTNRLAEEGESEDIWKRNAERLMNEVPDVPFGLYECPYPYKRILSKDLMKWCDATGRILFLKDTCCDVKQMQEKVESVGGAKLKIFNANAATLLESLKSGVSGYSGVMANFHPELYVWLTREWFREAEAAQELQAFLGVASLIERQLYPINAKYYLQLEGLDISLVSRTPNSRDLTCSERYEVEQLHELSRQYCDRFRLN